MPWRLWRSYYGRIIRPFGCPAIFAGEIVTVTVAIIAEFENIVTCRLGLNQAKSLEHQANDIVLAVNYFGVRDGTPWKDWRKRRQCILDRGSQPEPVLSLGPQPPLPILRLPPHEAVPMAVEAVYGRLWA